MLLATAVVDRILELAQWQGALVVLAVTGVAFSLNAALSRRWSPSRKRLMSAQFKRLPNDIVVGIALLASCELLKGVHASEWLVGPVGFAALVVWLTLALRAARALVFEWLFANSMREGVPLLLVDLIMLGASLVVVAALVHAVFLVEVTSLLATSAVASVVIGLALQDTLGHLVAGISLQLDRPFRLGDWIEVRSGSEHISGQVLEVSWRATLLLAIGEELVTIPNKTVAQGLVLNFSGRERPFVRAHLFRVPLGAPLDAVKAALLQAAKETPGVVAEPAPLALIIETTESWVALKLIIFLTDYGNHITIGDAVQARALALLAERGIALASARLLVESEVAQPTARPQPGPAPAPVQVQGQPRRPLGM
jgi:small-conductance mechanosensitive channel